jgi:hypothetical protein
VPAAQVFHHTDFPSLRELLAFWARVRVAVGPHGGALANAMFMPRGGAALVELFPVDPVVGAPLQRLAAGGARRGWTHVCMRPPCLSVWGRFLVCKTLSAAPARFAPEVKRRVRCVWRLMRGMPFMRRFVANWITRRPCRRAHLSALGVREGATHSAAPLYFACVPVT